MEKAFETIGHQEVVDRLRALRMQALRDVDAQLLLDAQGRPNDLQTTLATLEQVDKNIRREEVRAMQGWHHANTPHTEEPRGLPAALDPGKGSRTAMRADAIGFIGRALVLLFQKAGAYEFEPQSAIHIGQALRSVRDGRYEDAIAATEQAIATEAIEPAAAPGPQGAPTRWELAAELVELATRHVRHA